MYFLCMSFTETRSPDRALSAHEADVLSRARHPGVVELVDLGSGPEIRPLDGTPLAELVLSVEEIAAVAIVVATTVNDLHHLGVTHGGPTTRDIIVRSDGRPVLTGFGRGALLSGSPAAWLASDAFRADDRALGALIIEMLERCAPPAVCVAIDAPAAVRTSIRRLLKRRLPEGPAGALLRWGIDARDGRVTTSRLADGLRRAIPGARLPGRSPHPPTTNETMSPGGRWPSLRWPNLRRPHRRRGPFPRRSVVVACGLGGLACLTLAVVDRPSRPRLTPTPLAVSRSAPQTTSLCLDPGSGCTVTGSYRDGALSTPGGRFSVGRPGDVVAAGRWTCGSGTTLALLRPDRGEVWAFDQWPKVSTAATARLIGRVAQARTLTTASAGPCDTLVVGRADGTKRTFDRKAFG
ncbi:MAG: hypothetical protein NVSMB16_05030 [Acidimicrobiales bacterium]